jgi:hypothetical protein
MTRSANFCENPIHESPLMILFILIVDLGCPGGWTIMVLAKTPRRSVPLGDSAMVVASRLNVPCQ